jgi:hypothetical protein
VQDLDDVLNGLQAANFVDVVLGNHAPLLLLATGYFSWSRRWQASIGCTRATCPVTSRVGVVARHISSLGLSWLALSVQPRKLTDSKSTAVRCVVCRSDCSLALSAGLDEVVGQLLVEADVEYLDEHRQVLECAW